MLELLLYLPLPSISGRIVLYFVACSNNTYPKPPAPLCSTRTSRISDLQVQVAGAFKLLAPPKPDTGMHPRIPQILLAIICVTAVMVWSCIGCSRTFDTSKGLGIHHKSCKEYTSTTRKILKRTQTQERPDPAKLARRDLAGVNGG